MEKKNLTNIKAILEVMQKYTAELNTREEVKERKAFYSAQWDALTDVLDLLRMKPNEFCKEYDYWINGNEDKVKATMEGCCSVYTKTSKK